MKTRAKSAIFVMALYIIAVATRLFTPYIFDVIMVVIGAVASIEVARAYSNNKKTVNENICVSMIFTLYIGILIAIFNKWTLLLLLAYFGCVLMAYFLFTLIFSFVYKDKINKDMIKDCYIGRPATYCFIKAFRTVKVLFYPALLFGILIVLNHIDSFYQLIVTTDTVIKDIKVFSDFVIIATIVCTIFTDTFAMLIGSQVKGPKLCPNISPNKTISGAIGGFLMGVISVFGVYMLFTLNENFVKIINTLDITWLPVVAFAVLAPIFAQIGDIIASKIKRNCNIKDFGDIIPGHGGVMDRVDGLLFVGFVALIFTIITCL